jgi:hypothetical protein
MSKYYLSINQFAEFSSATESGKKRILKQQKNPNKLLIPWYQRAKGAIRKFLANVNDYSVIDNAIKILKEKNPANNRQNIDRNVSIEALEELKKVKLPRLLKYINYELITVEEKTLLINNVDIIVAPEVIIKASYKGEIVYGAVKIHISKGKPFNYNQATYVSALIHEFLTRKIAKPHERVLPELCLCLDVFSKRLVPAPNNMKNEIITIGKICDEVKILW